MREDRLLWWLGIIALLMWGVVTAAVFVQIVWDLFTK